MIWPANALPSKLPLEDIVLPSALDPGLYATTRRPVMQAETLPPAAYTSREFYDREVERIFMREWNFMGRADHVPKPGDYVALEYAGVPLILSRDTQGKLHALINSCRHRGSQVAEGEGNCRAFRCPYHSWAYGLDGKLLSAPEIEQTRNFDFADYGLVPLRLEIWAGFLFVNFDANAAPLATWLGDIPEKLASYNFGDMVCTRRKEYRLACNWKVYVENAMEAYHVPTVHRSTLQRQKGPHASKQETRGEWMALWKEH